MATHRLLLDYEFLSNETDPNDDRISTNYFTVHEWVFNDATKLAYQLPDYPSAEDAYGPTPYGEYYSRPTDEEFYDDCDGTTRRGYYHNGSGGVTNTAEANSEACGYTPPASAGTVLRYECQGLDRYRIEANGTGGERAVLVQKNSPACGYEPPAPVPGCTDPEATNYDPNATEDNGSCAYVPRLDVTPPAGLSALGRPVPFVLASASTGQAGARARLLITVATYLVPDMSLIIEGETYTAVEGNPGPGQFNSALTLAAQLSASVTLAARYRISQPDPASIRLVALAEGRAFTPVVGVDDQEGGVGLELAYGVDSLRSQGKAEWSCYAEIWAVPAATWGGAVDLGSAYLVDRLEQLYRATANAYTFDLAPALLPLVGHSRATSTDRLVAYFVRYGEAYLPEGESQRRRVAVGSTTVCWGIESAVPMPAGASIVQLTSLLSGGFVPVGLPASHYPERAYVLAPEGATLRATLTTRTLTGQLSSRTTQAIAGSGVQMLELGGLLAQLPATAHTSQLTLTVDGQALPALPRWQHAPARACLHFLSRRGSYETLWLAGLTDPNPKRQPALFARGAGGGQAVRRVDFSQARKLSTGPLSRAGLDWLSEELASSPEVLLVQGGQLEPVVITGWNPNYDEAGNSYSLTFELEPQAPTYVLSN